MTVKQINDFDTDDSLDAADQIIVRDVSEISNNKVKKTTLGTLATFLASYVTSSGVFQPISNLLTAIAALGSNGIIVRTSSSGAVSRSIAAPAAGITISNGDGVSGNPTLALANDLAAVEGLSGAGIAARTAADTWALRTLQPPAAGLTITNPAGTAGDPTFALANDLAALEGISATGFATRTASETWTARTHTGTANEITVTNGDGVSGAPTYSLPSALTFTGKTVTGGTFTAVTVSGASAWNGNKIGLAVGGTNADLSATGGTSQVLKQASSGAAITVGQLAASDLSGLGTGIATFLGTPSSANLAAALTDETGSGAAVFATSPTLVTPNLGTPSAIVLTSATGLPVATGISGFGTGVATALAVNVGSTGAVVVNGGALGTPSSGNGSALTALNGSNISSGTVPPANLGSGSSISTKFLRGDSTWQTIPGGGDALTTSSLAQFASTTSLELKGVISDETGSGLLVFATSPTLTTPNIGAPSAGTLTNCTGLPIAGITGLGTGVGTFLGTPSSANLASAITDETGSGALVFGTSPTIATATMTNPTVTNYVETANAPAAGSSFTVSLSSGTYHRFTTNANTTVTLPSSTDGKSYTVEIIYGGAHTLTWSGGGTLKWAGGTTPTPTSVNGKKDVFSFLCDGSETKGFVGGLNF